jgi:hypothetical protein
VHLLAITGLPILLTGAALVGLPVLLHLMMKQEPKRFPFPSYRFLKQKQQLNQRKIRLRHLILLLLRMALIALICLSLFQPTLLSQGFSLRGDRPITAVFVLDTSPSMGYILSERSGLTETRQRGLKLLEEPASGPWTCLDDARARILEILEDLSPASRIAIVDTSDRSEISWATSVPEARQRVRDIKKTRGNAQPVTRSLETAYNLLAKSDLELEPGQEPFPRLLAVFSDRTTASWDAARQSDLESARDRVPPPNVNHVYVDVGVDKPVNSAIRNVEMKPQIIPPGQPGFVQVTVDAVGGNSENILLFQIDGQESQKVALTLTPEKPFVRPLRLDGLKPGLHQARISLMTPDALPFDNDRYLTFRVREPRPVLVLVDSSPFAWFGFSEDQERKAYIWKAALEAFGWYSCDVRTQEEVVSGRVDLSKYEQVTMLGLVRPTALLWNSLFEYVQKGGQLIVAPGAAEMDVAAYQTPAAVKVLPRKYERWYQTSSGKMEETWTWNALSPQRPMLKVFRDYREASDWFDKFPPVTKGFWKVEAGAPDRVVVSYNDAPDPQGRSAALLEMGIGPRGKVLQFTVPMGTGSEKIHNYNSANWFYLALVKEAVSNLIGDSDDQNFNFPTGQNVLIKWPTGEMKPDTPFYLSGPDVAVNDAKVIREGNEPYFRLGPEKTGSAGNFTFSTEDQSWLEGFSLNVPSEESNLERLPLEAIEGLFGPQTVYTADKQLTLTDILSGKFTQPIELFPFLMILLLLVMASENLLANRFYRKRREG